MKRLLATIRWDFQLQIRNGFYYAAVFVAVVLVVLLNQLPEASRGFLLPVVLAENLVINAFYFMGGLVLLEKGEGTLEAQIVTPLRTWEYLVSKVVTLTVLSVVEALAIVIFSYGPGFNWLPLVGGIMLLSVFFVLLGFIAVARYDSINEYLFPSFLFTAILSAPLVFYFGFWDSPALYLHPVQAPLELLKAAFGTAAAWQWPYALAYGGLWIAGIFGLTTRSFYRFVIRKEGVRG